MSLISTFSGQSNGSASVTINSVVIPASASARCCTLHVLMRGADNAQTTLSTTSTEVSLGSQDFTLDSSTYRQFTSYQAIECGYILDADLLSGTVTATITRGGSIGGMIAVIRFFDGVTQAAPKVALNGAASSPSDPFSTSLSPTIDGFLVDMIGTSNALAVFTEQETGQVESDQQAVTGASAAAACSVREVTTANNAMSWDTDGNTQRTTHIILGLEAATSTPAVDDINTDETISDGEQDNTFETSNFSGEITTVSIGDGTYSTSATGVTSTSGNGDFDLPDITSYTGDTIGAPLTTASNTVTATLGDGTDTASLAVTYEPKAGWSVQEITSATKDEGSLFETVSETVPNGSIALTEDAHVQSVSSTGIIIFEAGAENNTAQWWDASNGTWKQINVTVDDTSYGSTPTDTNSINSGFKAGIQTGITRGFK